MKNVNFLLIKFMMESMFNELHSESLIISLDEYHDKWRTF